MVAPNSCTVATGDLVQACDHNTLRCDALTHTHCGCRGSATLAAVTVCGILTVSGDVTLASARNCLQTNNGSAFIYRTGGCAGDFCAEAGHLVLQPRTSTARDIRMYAGSTTPTERLTVSGSSIANGATALSIRRGAGCATALQAVQWKNFQCLTCCDKVLVLAG